MTYIVIYVGNVSVWRLRVCVWRAGHMEMEEGCLLGRLPTRLGSYSLGSYRRLLLLVWLLLSLKLGVNQARL